jgi:hypothetical protein
MLKMLKTIPFIKEKEGREKHRYAPMPQPKYYPIITFSLGK